MLAREVDVTIPRWRGSWANCRNFCASTQRRQAFSLGPLQLVDRVNSIAGQVGGLKYAIAWLKTSHPSSAIGGDRRARV
jgi:hypothetical protein